MFFSKAEIGIDLGTSNILIYEKSKGIVLNDPAIIVYDTKTEETVAVGSEAKEMVGKTPENIQALRPLTNGIINDFDLTAELLRRLLKKSVPSLRKPTVVVNISSSSTSVEQRAIHNALAAYGAGNIHFIEDTVAAAIGAGLPIEEPIASVILDLGGGTSEIGIISFGGVVASKSLPIGGNSFDEKIVQLVKEKYNLLIGSQTAEQLKISIGQVNSDHKEKKLDIIGRNLVTGLPESVTISSYDVYRAMKDSLEKIASALHATLEKCPPELSGDIVDHGIVLTGGGALLGGMKEWLMEETKVPIILAASPLEAVALGTGDALSMIGNLKKSKF